MQARVFIGHDPETGAARHITRSTTKGIKAARTLRAKLMTEVAEGKNGSLDGSFGELLDEWLALGERIGRSPTTIDGYRKKIERTIRPELGAIVLSDFTMKTLDDFMVAGSR